jgi:methyl-accepting chemotaxis protein
MFGGFIMNRIFGWFRKSFKAKLVAAFLFVALLPLCVVGYLSYLRCGNALDQAAGAKLEDTARSVIDKIDRNLFERYGDVQAIAFNPMAGNNPLDMTKAVNFYTTAYGCYDLMLIADTEGKIVAANTVTFDGKPLDTSKLIGRNVRGQAWFDDVVNGKVASGQSFAGDFGEDKLIADVYGNRGLTLAFSAPIRDDNNKIIGVCSTRASFERTAGTVLKSLRDDYKARGREVEVQVFARNGLLLEDADPDAVLHFNIVDKGLQAAKLATEGKSGSTAEEHLRRKVMQMNGYASSKGYLNYPGHGWGLLVREDLSQVRQAAVMLGRFIVVVGLVAGLLVAACAYWYGNGVNRKLGQVVSAMGTIAKGDFSARIPVASQDEFGTLANTVNQTAEQLGESNAINLDYAAKMAAISKSQAIIEFTMDGTIVSANDNLLNTLGYTLDEIKGRHHSMFVAENYRNSSEYREFWSRLNRGENLPGEYQRIGKGGKEVWIQASYNPIPDQNGKLVKVVKYATEVTDAVKSRHEMARILHLVNENAGTLGSSAEELTAVSTQMAANAEETSAQANVVSAASEQVSKNVQTVTTGVEEMNSAIREIAKNATESARVAQQAVATAESANATISKLGESSIEIGNVIKVITSIAEQTNLLALNATIEAARAGEAGKGFAVVANEVKELAKETARATEDIGRKVEAIQNDTQGAVDSIQQIGQVIVQINDISNTIASAVEEQTATAAEMSRNVSEAAKGTAEIAQNITAVAQAAQNTTQGATNSQQAASELSRMASDLQKLGAGRGASQALAV